MSNTPVSRRRARVLFGRLWREMERRCGREYVRKFRFPLTNHAYLVYKTTDP